MGIRHLDTFIRKKVAKGCSKVNIEHAIREYCNEARESNPPTPPPVIVIDLMALHCTLTSIDMESLFFGARFNVGFWTIDRFFAKLKGLGAELEFFLDGTVPSFKLQTWRERRDTEYQELIELIDAVDKGTDIETILEQLGSPGCSYAVEYLAKKHGRLTVSMEKECDQELAAFACKSKAMAIISNDSDFLIFDGDWRYWSCREIDINTLEAVEYNRRALLEHLGLNFSQMPLFATLCGNDIVKFEEVQHFHYRLGQFSRKFINVANFVRKQPADLSNPADLQKILKHAFGSRYKQIEMRFQQSLDFYKTNYTAANPNPNNDPAVAVVLEQSSPFMYQMWHNQPYAVSFGLCDMRSDDLGNQLPRLALRIMLRTAGIIVFHRLKRRRFYACSLVVKLNHESNHAQQRFPVEFPPFMEPPTLVDLFSRDPAASHNLLDTKLQLLSWIVSDSLDYRRVKLVLRPLLATALTLYLLMEQRVLQLFEADLLLQVAHEVVTETYDPAAVEYPGKVDSRPFRLVFFYKEVYNRVSNAIESVGLNLKGFRDDPPFDGVLFHSRYGDWAKGGGDLMQIEQWRIYAVDHQRR
ncbi:uncharacterized protein LOC135709708 [Ochlerotatus camptorhynchus]|uniref:uncharacterized protein LOC135709708 n=1 Tax=Ochlerotatus camptorhynchus TaxID=644619 RepID=UPI0031D9C264